MANTQSAQKRIRSNERKHVRNQRIRSRTRTSIRAAREALEAGNPEDARRQTLAAAGALDKAAAKGVLHKNNAARRKSRLMKKLARIEAAKKA